MPNSRPGVSRSSPAAAQRCAEGAGLDGGPAGRVTLGRDVRCAATSQPYAGAAHQRHACGPLYPPESPTDSAEEPKKIAQPNPMTTPTRSVSDYETLRAAVLGADPIRGPDLATVCHSGLAIWLKQSSLMPVAQQPCARTASAIVDPAPATNELIRLVAGIVVALAVGSAHG